MKATAAKAGVPAFAALLSAAGAFMSDPSSPDLRNSLIMTAVAFLVYFIPNAQRVEKFVEGAINHGAPKADYPAAPTQDTEGTA
jgi:hypothetical protein